MSMISHHLFTHNPISSTFTALHSAAAAEPFLAEDLISVAVEACPELGDAFVGDYSTLAEVLATLADRDTAILPETPELEGKAFIVLAPTDAAFQDLFEQLNTTKEAVLEDTERLTSLIKHHVSIIETATWTGRSPLIALDNRIFDLSNDFVTGPSNNTRAQYVSVDEFCKDSPQVVFYGIDTVFFVPEWDTSTPGISTSPMPSLSETAAAEPFLAEDLISVAVEACPELGDAFVGDYSTLAEVLATLADRDTAILPETPELEGKAFIVLAPTDAAFQDLFEQLNTTKEAVLEDTERLTSLIKHHVSIIETATWTGRSPLIALDNRIFDLSNDFVTGPSNNTRAQYVSVDEFCKDSPQVVFYGIDTVFFVPEWDTSIPEASSFGSAVNKGLIFSLMVATLMMI
jgi:uncharacterized surface protein with fasciclin (FAS1) repeats